MGENVEGRLRSTFRVVRQKQGLSSQRQALAVASAVTEHAAQVNVRASSECAEPRPSSRLRRLLSRPLSGAPSVPDMQKFLPGFLRMVWPEDKAFWKTAFFFRAVWASPAAEWLTPGRGGRLLLFVLLSTQAPSLPSELLASVH